MQKSIYEIAKDCSVSTATVSRVLNNSPKVSEKTKKKILAAIGATQFVPAISKNSFENVGVFVGAYESESFMLPLSPYCAELISGLGSALYSYNYSLSLIPVHNIPKTRDEFKLFCFRRHIGAAVFLNISLHDGFIADFAGLLPIVCIGTQIEGIPSIRTDNTAVTTSLMEYLHDLGHRTIALLNVDMNIQDHTERYEAAIAACARLGMTIPKACVLPTNQHTYDDLPYLLESMIGYPIGKSVTAFVCFDNQFALRILHLLKSMNLSVPDDVSLVGFDDYAFAQFSDPPLTAIRQPILNLGILAGNRILIELKKLDAAADLPIHSQLILRKSVGPAKR